MAAQKKATIRTVAATPRASSSVGIGIDLGTTKSCIAVAGTSPQTGVLLCEMVDLAGSPGCRGPVLPSAVAITSNGWRFGEDAMRLRGRPGMRSERDYFHETKNLMGLRYTFDRAPEMLKTPADVAAAVLARLWELAGEKVDLPDDAPVVITVPASFQGAQRRATLQAARDALGDKRMIRLLDEPCAAFLDLEQRHPEKVKGIRDGANLLVFDFGGGTCDVAIFRLMRQGDLFGTRLLGSSRYHRLGGGDIDRAIVHDHLLPRLLAQNGISPHDVSWGDRRDVLEPQMLDGAEALKLALSWQVKEAGEAGKLCIAALGPIEVKYGERRLHLRTPSLAVPEFEHLLMRFLDPEPPPDSSDEYVQRSSIFAPILQALGRACLQTADVDALLLCGSSTLLPSVSNALKRRFPDAMILMEDGFDTLQGTVARGAAWQARALAMSGHPLIVPVCSNNLSLRTGGGPITLAVAGQQVPLQSPEPVRLRPPIDSETESVAISVEVVTEGDRMVGRTLWQLPPPVRCSDQLELCWSLDEDQCAELRLTRLGSDDTRELHMRFEAPIMHRDVGQTVRARQLEREESLRRGELSIADMAATYEAMARDCAVLGEHDKALYYVSHAMQEAGATPVLLNLRGMYREQTGNIEGAIASYREAGNFAPTRFNLALLHYTRGEYEIALSAIEESLDIEDSRARRVLQGEILTKMNRGNEARQAWQDAVAGRLELKQHTDWELSWLHTAAHRLDDNPLVKRIDEQRQGLIAAERLPPRQGVLPERAA